MKRNLKEQLLTENDCYRQGRPLKPKGVMVHSTGVAQPDPQTFLKRWNKPDVDKCVHAFVSRDEVIQTLPWTMRSWHAGAGSKGSANNTHLSFECCEPAGHTYRGGEMIGYDVEANQAYFDKIYRNAVELTAMLCTKFSLDPLKPGVVICHAEGHELGVASGHADVLHWWPRHGVTMDRFRRDVAAAMKDGEEEEENMTQEQFDQLMNDYLSRRAEKSPAGWSERARAWAKEAGLVAGEDAAAQRYPAFATREETVQMLYRLNQLLKEKQ